MAMIYDPETGDYYDNSAAVYQVQAPSFDWGGLFSKAGDAALSIGQKLATTAIDRAKQSVTGGSNPAPVAVARPAITSAGGFSLNPTTTILLIAAAGIALYMFSSRRR